MELKDIFLGPLFLAIVYGMAYLFRPKLTNKLNRKYFIPALTIKMYGVLFFSFVYQFYYGGGDTFAYHHDTGVFLETLKESPIMFFKMFTTEAADYSSEAINYIQRTWLFRGDNEWDFVRYMVPFSIVTYNSYLGMSFLLGFFTFLGTWKIYQLFILFHPKAYKVLPWVIFTIPSCIFWSSGLLKDTLCLGAIGFLAYYSVTLIYFRSKVLWSLFWIIFSAFILQTIKYHIVLTFIPGLILWTLFTFQKKIRNDFLKVIASIFAVSLSIGFLFLAGNAVIQQIEESEYFKEVQFQMYGFQTDHGWRTDGHGGGDASTYTLGETDLSSFWGMMQSVPAAINVTLFRPYPWEVTKVVTFLSSLESLLFFLGTVFVLIKGKVLPVFTKAISTPEVVLCLSYALILGFVVGFISFNFGVLTRFKTPLLPFYTSALVILYYQTKKEKSKKRKKKPQLAFN